MMLPPYGGGGRLGNRRKAQRTCILAGIEVLLPTGQQQAGRAAPSLVDAALFEARYDDEAPSAASIATIGRDENGGSFL